MVFAVFNIIIELCFGSTTIPGKCVSVDQLQPSHQGSIAKLKQIFPIFIVSLAFSSPFPHFREISLPSTPRCRSEVRIGAFICVGPSFNKLNSCENTMQFRYRHMRHTYRTHIRCIFRIMSLFDGRNGRNKNFFHRIPMVCVRDLKRPIRLDLLNVRRS